MPALVPADAVAVAFSSAGELVSGAKLNLFEAGTTTPVTMYSDAALTASLGSSITFGSTGRPQTAIYVPAGTYKIDLTDASDVSLDGYPIDDIRVATDVFNNFAGTSAPTVNDDSSDGYAVGSTWIDTTNAKAYKCFDASVAAADWREFAASQVTSGERTAGTETALRSFAPADVKSMIDTHAPSELPRSYGAGCALSNGTDADHDIDIAVGTWRDDGNAADLTLSSVLTKQIDAAWAVGDDAGGLDTGTVAADTWYHVWLIRRSDTGVTDALYSTSASSPTMPTNYDQKRRIGAVLTDSSSNILGFSQHGDEFLWDDPPLDVDVTTLSTTAVLYTLSVPSGVKVEAKFNMYLDDTTNVFERVYVSSPDQNDEAASETAAPLAAIGNLNTGGSRTRTAGSDSKRTNTSSQVRARASAAIGNWRMATLGWVDRRGRDD